MHASPFITTPSALLLFSLSPFVSPVLIIFTFCLSNTLLSFPLVLLFVVSPSFPFPPSFFICHSVVISFCLFSFLSPALLLTSSAVLRPLHEANAHSGLAVAACMRSTGGPIKRRQEQEMERETGSAHPQGPCRYHNSPPLCVRSGAFLQITSDPLAPFLPPSRCVCPQLSECCKTFLIQDPSVCLLWMLAV